jgi:hypothetical protein
MRRPTMSKTSRPPRVRPVLELLESRIAPATTRFAMIGDYGAGSTAEQKVATLVNSWSPDFVVTVGDNNYGTSNYDAHVGQYYHNYIYPYSGSYGAGASSNKFWPAVGNEDYGSSGLTPYVNFFTLPGNERYYDVTIGPVEFFMLNGDSREPDGNTVTSPQATWLRNELAASTATWKLVLTHFPPYSTAQWAVSTAARWPYQQWGATAVFSGHSHTYERLLEDNNFPYFVDGLGGDSRDTFTDSPAAGSQVRFTGDYGAMLIQADTSQITFQFVGAWNYPGQVFDTYTIHAATSTGPAVPSNLTATAARTAQLGLAWADQSASVTGFKIERSTDGSTFTQIATVGASTTTYSDTGLTPGTQYWYRVRATSASGDSAYSNQASEIARGVATHLQLSALTTDVAGQPFSFTVAALDAFGNTAVGYTGTVRLSSSDGQAVLPGDYAYLGSDVGMHSFSATLNTSGSQSMTATDTSTPSVTGTQSGITVSSGSTGSTSLLTVNSMADNTSADNFLTLREAIQVVNGTLGRPLTAGEQAQLSGTLGNHDTIQFNLPSGPQTITLTGGALSITHSITITGPGPTILMVKGNNSDRVLIVGQIWSPNPSLVVSISGLTIAGGNATVGSNNYGGGLLNFGTTTVSNTVFSSNVAGSSGGGGAYNVGSLTLNNDTFTGNSVTSGGAGAGVINIGSATLQVNGCTFSGNNASGGGSGAGFANSGTATISGSTFTGGTAASNGGGIFNSVEGVLTVNTSAFTNNSAASDGGAIDNDGTLTVNASLFANNTSVSEGGGLDSSGTVLGVTNSTFSGNVAGSRGGGISSTGALQVTNSTLTGNRAVSGSSAAFGGGLYDGVPAKLFNTIVAGNFQGAAPTTASSDIYGNVDPTSAFNLIGTGGGLVTGSSGNQVGVVNPGLGALGDNGGPTQTIALQLGSPALDHGSNAYVAAGTTDERGLPRIANGTVDVGAFEAQPAVITVTVTATAILLTGFPTPITAGVAGSFTVTARDASGNTVTGYAGTVHFASTDAKASLPADYTFTSSDHGVHTFTATLKTATVQSLTVSDVATSSLTSTQSGIAVQPAAASQLLISGPSSVGAGKTFSLTVTVVDAYGNIATNYSGSIHFASSDSTGSIPSDYTFTAADQGQHTFAGAKFKKKGSQTITITDTLKPALTAKLTVKVT